MNNIYVRKDTEGNTQERNVDFYNQFSIGTTDENLKAQLTKNNQTQSHENKNLMNIHEGLQSVPPDLTSNVKKSKNLGKLQEPRKISVVKNANFDSKNRLNVKQFPIGVLGEENFDHKIQASIGSHTYPFGSINSHKDTGNSNRKNQTTNQASKFKQRGSPPKAVQSILKQSKSPPKKQETSQPPFPKEYDQAQFQTSGAVLNVSRPNIRILGKTHQQTQKASSSAMNHKIQSATKQKEVKSVVSIFEKSKQNKTQEQPFQSLAKPRAYNSQPRDTYTAIHASPEHPYRSTSANQVKPIGAGPGQTIAKEFKWDLQQEYYHKKERMETRLKEEVLQHSIGRDAIKMKRVHFPGDEVQDNNQPDFEVGWEDAQQLDLVPRRESSLRRGDLKPRLGINEKTVDYVRSVTAVQMKIESDFKQNINYTQMSNNELSHELNKLLLELDKINHDRRDINQALIDQIRFVRDLQGQLGTANNGEIKDIIDKELERQFRVEKQRNIQLKELIRQNQLEHDQLHKDLEYLLSQKNVTYITKSGNQLNLTRIVMSIDELLRYRETVARNILTTQQDLDRFNLESNPLEHAIGLLQEDLVRIERERNDLNDQLRDFQNRYDEVFYKNEAHIRAENQIFRKSKNYHTTRVLSNTLQSIFNRHLHSYFNYIRYQQTCDYNQISSILAFRKLCYRYNDQRVSKYFYVWYQKALKPTQLKKVNRQVTKFMTKNLRKWVYLSRWQNHLLQNSTLRSYKEQLMAQTLSNVLKNMLRHKRRAFDIWRGILVNEKSKVSKMIRLWLTRLESQKNTAFQRWKAMVLEQDMKARLNAKLIRLTVMTYKSHLFQNWRQYVAHTKQKKTTRKLKVWTALNKYRMQMKYMKTLTWEVVKLNNLVQNDMLQSVFNALRYQKECNKFDLVDASKVNIDQAILITTETKKAVAVRSQNKAVKKAVKEGVVNPFIKIISQYFAHWKKMTLDYKRILNDKIKMKIITIYKRGLSEAFEKWKSQGQQKKKKKKMVMMESIETTNVTMENDIKENEKKIKAEAVRSVNKGNTKVKKLIQKAYLAELKFRFGQWSQAIQIRNQKEQTVSKVVLDKMKKRLYQQAFDKFKESVTRQQRIEGLDRKTDQTIEKFKNRQLRKFFNAFAANKAHNLETRKKMRPILDKTYKATLSEVFNRWIKFREHKRTKTIKTMQMQMEEQVMQAAAEKNDQNDIIFAQEKKRQEAVRQQRKMGSNSLRKVISQWKTYQSFMGFNKWKEVTQHFNSQKGAAQTTIINRFYHRVLHNAFSKWKKHQFTSLESQAQLSIKVEQEDIVMEGKKRVENQVRIAQKRERAGYKLDQLSKDKEFSQKLISNQIAKLIYDKENFFVIGRREHIFQTWRELARKKAFLINRLGKLMRQDFQKLGFNSIRDADYNNNRENRIRRRLFFKAFGKYVYVQYADAFNKWKLFIFAKTKNKLTETLTQMGHNQFNSEQARNRIKVKRVAMMMSQNKENMKKAVWDALVEHKNIKVLFKKKTKEFQTRQYCLVASYAIRKWGIRASESVVFKTKFKFLRGVLLNRMDKRNCFNALLAHTKKYSQLKLRLKQLWQRYSTLCYREAFDCINHKKNLVLYHNEQQKVLSQKLMNRIAILLKEKNLRYWFNKFKSSGQQNSQKNDAVSQIMHKVITRFYREAFEIWKKQAQRLETIRIENQEGQMALEVRDILADSLNLRRMLAIKGIMNPAECRQAIKEDDKKTDYLLNKARIRWEIYGEGRAGQNDKWLLVYCWDILVNFKNKRKKMYEKTKALGWFIGKCDSSKLGHAFFLWKHNLSDMERKLRGMTQQQLFNQYHQVQKQLGDMIDQLEDRQSEIEDLKRQREWLIDKVVHGQKLALYRCRFSYRYALIKRWEHWKSTSNSEVKGQVMDALHGQITAIQEAKDACDRIQTENEDIAEQNEALKEGAKEGEEHLLELQEVQQEVETMNDQLIEMTDQIRELLAQNKYLKQALDNHEM